MTRTEAWAARGVVVVALLGLISLELGAWFPPIATPCADRWATLLAKEAGQAASPAILIVQQQDHQPQVVRIGQDPQDFYSLVLPGASLAVRVCGAHIVSVAAYGATAATE